MAVNCDSIQVYRGPRDAERRGRRGEQRARLEHRLLGVRAGRARSSAPAATPRLAHARDRRAARRRAPADRGRRHRPLPAGGAGRPGPAAARPRRRSARRSRRSSPSAGPAALHARACRRAGRERSTRTTASGSPALTELSSGRDRAPPPAPRALWTAELRHPTLLVGLDDGPRARWRSGSTRGSTQMVAAGAGRGGARGGRGRAPRGPPARRSASSELAATSTRRRRPAVRRRQMTAPRATRRRQLTWMRQMDGVDADRPRPDSTTADEVAGRDRCERRQLVRDRLRRRMKFEKWQALGNDYLIVEQRALPWELTPRARSGGSATRTSGSAPTASCCSRRAEDPALRRRAADLQPRRLRGRALRQRRPRGDPLPAPPRLDRRRRVHDPDRRPGRSRPTITSERDLHGRHGPRRDRPPTDFPSGGDGRPRRRSSAGGRDWSFQHVSIGNPQCAIEVGERARGARPGRRSARRSKHHELFPNRTNVSLLRRRRHRGSARGSSSAGWGRRSPPAPAPAARRSPPSCAAPPSPITVELDGGELAGRDLRRARRAPDRLGRAGLRRRALAGAACEALADL